MRKLTCEICLPDITQYYDDIYDIVENNQRLISMAIRHPQGSKLLNSGRVVVLRDPVRRQLETLETLLTSPLAVFQIVQHRDSVEVGSSTSCRNHRENQDILDVSFS